MTRPAPALDPGPRPGPPPPGPVRAWILAHDDSRLFVVLYIGLALVLSIAIGLFWLVAVVAVHLGFECVRHAHAGPARGVLRRALWEVKLDVGLILFALALTAYLDVILGVVGLSSAARVGLQGGARLAGWQRALRGALLSVDDAAQVARAALARRRGEEADGEEDPAPGPAPAPRVAGGWTGRWSLGDRLSVGFGAGCLALLLAAPLLTPHTPATLLALLAAELHPFP
jgi:hypothetical protein